MAAGQAALDFVSRLEPEDLLVCLISGGGSALATAPVEGISLEDVQAVTSSALGSGIDIGEVNNLRRCLDRVKGGGLAAATGAQVLGIILSDVIGDRVDAIASGPTVPCQPDPDRAVQLLERLLSAPSLALRQALRMSASRHVHGAGDRIRNVIVGNARAAAEGARLQAVREGFAAVVLEPSFKGEARLVGEMLGHRLAIEAQAGPRPACLIAFGESTVTIAGPHGLGGRNQELALAATETLDALQDCMLIAFATDGEYGPTDAAGAVVTGTTAARAKVKGMVPGDYLARHDSHRYFAALGDLVRPGYTGTNVNDMVLLLTL
jgi:hydroxypyruvate reductase